MHSNLTPLLAKQRLADLHEQAARHRLQHPAKPDQPAPARTPQRHLNLMRLAIQSVHRRRTA